MGQVCPAPQQPTLCGRLGPGSSGTGGAGGVGVRRRSQDSGEARIWTRPSSPFWTFSLPGSPDLPGPDMQVQAAGAPPWEGGYQERKGRA